MLLLWAKVNLGAMAMKGVLCISQSFSIARTSSDYLVSYQRHSLGGEVPTPLQRSSVFYSPNWLGSNSNEEVAPHITDIQNRSLTTRCSLVSCPGYGKKKRKKKNKTIRSSCSIKHIYIYIAHFMSLDKWSRLYIATIYWEIHHLHSDLHNKITPRKVVLF